MSCWGCLLGRYAKQTIHNSSHTMWKCSACGNLNPIAYSKCVHCGHDFSGISDKILKVK